MYKQSTRRPLLLMFCAFCLLLLISPLSAQDQQVVEWWGWNPDAERAAVFIEAFEAAHPDIQVNYSFYNYVDYLNVLRLGVASDTGPDVFNLQAGALLGQYLDFELDLTPFMEAAHGDDWRSRFYPLGLDPLVEGEVTYALPWFLSAAGYLWYNQTMLDELSLTAPTTWDEFVAVTNAATEQGVTGFIQGARDAWINYDMFIAIANEVAPGKIYQAEAGEIPWNDPDLVMAMEYWRQLFENGVMPEGALAISQYPDARDTWVQGGALSVMMGSWNTDSMDVNYYTSAQESLGFDEVYEFRPVLFPDVNGDGVPGRLFGGPDVALAVNNLTDVQDAAVTFVDWMTSEEAQTIQGQFLNVPALIGIPLSDENVKTEAERAVLTQILADLENAEGAREFQYPEFKTALADALQNVAIGAQTPEEAMTAVQDTFAMIDRSGS